MNQLRRLFDLDRPLIMGILNVTPDSFSNDGEHFDADVALEHALHLAGQGADIIDVGGESTRPGAQRVSEREQIRRTQKIIERLEAKLPAECLISIDTTRVEVARAAVEAGAGLLNDVAAGRESAMIEYAGQSGLPIVLMHMQGQPSNMQAEPYYDDVVQEVKDFLLERAAFARSCGIDPQDIVIDPGIGFGKNRQHNLQLVAALDKFVETGYPVMLGASRKRFMGAITRETEFRQLVGATCATTALGVSAGVKIFRVHDVQPNRQAAEVSAAIHAVRQS